MLLNLKSLTESLDKKYKVDETLKEDLNEAFDESMPKWLKDRLGFTAMRANISKSNANKTYRDKYPGQYFSDYKKERGQYGNESELYGLAGSFLNHNIDISKVKVHEAPVPDKVPRITKNQQIVPIFLMRNGQVWAKGINDREKYATTNKPFPALKNDELLNDCTAYAYIDLNDLGYDQQQGDKRFAGTDSIQSIRDARQDLKRELNSLPNYYRKNGGWNSDKSGYSNSINVERYKKYAAVAGFNKLESKIDDVVDRFNNCKIAIMDYLGDIQANTGDTNAQLVEAEQFISSLGYVNRSITRAFDTLEIAHENEQSAQGLNNYEKQYASNTVKNYLQSAGEQLQTIENRFKDSILTAIDEW